MLIFGALVFAVTSMMPGATDAAYRAEIERWRERRQAALKSDDGWLAVAGLFWLKHGINTVGTEAGNDIVLPAGSAPGRVGAFDMHDGIISFEAAAGVNATVNGKPATASALKPDSSELPDILRLNGLTLLVIQRGDRYGIRLKDKNSEMRKAFTGLKYFPVKEEYRVKAKFRAL